MLVELPACDMTTSADVPSTDSPPEVWQQALQEFRARAQLLFEAQRERIEFLEAAIAEHVDLAAVGSQAARGDALPDDESDQGGLRVQLAQCRQLLDARADELKQLRSQVAEQAGTSDGTNVEALLEELSELKLERDQIITRLADAERQIEGASATDAEQLDELRKRFEMAVQEIRELKAKNDELERQTELGNARETAQPAAGGFDWEQQKLRMMQQLEDGDAPELQEAEDKLTVESTIRITDQVIADKDCEIADLKQLLENQSSSIGDVAVGAAAIAEVLDQDQLIREEREKLTRLQDDWREKLRQAEIDISVERAKLARERAELEEKARVLESEQRAFLASGGSMTDGDNQKPQSGRWLSRLGLKDDEK
jgi:hypothetical protein